MPQRLAWNDIRLVLAVGEEGSLSAGARRLGVDNSTLHRRIGAIEKQLGVRLFDRARSGYSPTAAGEEVIALGRRIDEDASGVETRLAGEDMRPAGTVRITTSDTLLMSLVTPAVVEIAARHPLIRLEIATTSRSVSLSRREADVAVRVTDTPPPHLIGRRVGTIVTATYGSPDLLDRLDIEPGSRGDPNAYRWIGFDDELAHLASARWMARAVASDRIVYRTDTIPGIAEAAGLGLAVALLPEVAVRGRNLRRLDPSPGPATETGVWLLTHPDLRATARVTTVMKELASILTPALA